MNNDIRVGNRVRVIDDWCSLGIKIGDTGKVTAVEPTTPYKDEWGGDNMITFITDGGIEHKTLHYKLEVIKKVTQFKKNIGMEDYNVCSIGGCSRYGNCDICTSHTAMIKCTTSDKPIQDGEYIVDYPCGARNVLSVELYNAMHKEDLI